MIRRNAFRYTALLLLLSAAACKAEADSSPVFCADVNAQRKSLCMTARFDCAKVLESAPPELVEKVGSCPISATMDLPPVSGEHPEIGNIPCCVSYNPTGGGQRDKDVQ